jgi:hypothetical protein
VAELRIVAPTVIAVLASGPTLDGLVVGEGATACRVSPREALVIGGEGLDPDDVRLEGPGLVEDVSDGWAAFELRGGDAAEAFLRLSELELPAEGFVQGDVARIGAKVLTVPERVTILVPASLGAFMDERIRTDCAEVLG